MAALEDKIIASWKYKKGALDRKTAFLCYLAATWLSATLTEPGVTWQVPGLAARPRTSCAKRSPLRSEPTPPRRMPTS